MKTKATVILSIAAILLAAFSVPAYAAPVALSSTTSGTATTISSSSYSPQPGDINLTRDKVFLDMEASHLVVATGQPVKVSAVLAGYLPDPCHVLRIVVGSATISNTINIQVYSLFKQGVACITVIQPFKVTVSLGSFTSGQYTVVVNGSKLGSFSAGAATTTSVVK